MLWNIYWWPCNGIISHLPVRLPSEVSGYLHATFDNILGVVSYHIWHIPLFTVQPHGIWGPEIPLDSRSCSVVWRPKTPYWLSSLPGYESQPGHVRKLPVTWSKTASHELATIWHKWDEKRRIPNSYLILDISVTGFPQLTLVNKLCSQQRYGKI